MDKINKMDMIMSIKEDILIRLTSIFREKFQDSSIVLTSNTKADDIYEWDSLKHVMLIITIEKEFQLKFDPIELSQMENIGQMIVVIERLIKDRNI